VAVSPKFVVDCWASQIDAAVDRLVEKIDFQLTRRVRYPDDDHILTVSVGLRGIKPDTDTSTLKDQAWLEIMARVRQIYHDAGWSGVNVKPNGADSGLRLTFVLPEDLRVRKEEEVMA